MNRVFDPDLGILSGEDTEETFDAWTMDDIDHVELDAARGEVADDRGN